MAKPERLEVTSRIQWVRLDQMKINPQAQRSLNDSWAATLAEEFNPDLMGFVHVSHRDGWYYVIDGQHRVRPPSSSSATPASKFSATSTRA